MPIAHLGGNGEQTVPQQMMRKVWARNLGITYIYVLFIVTGLGYCNQKQVHMPASWKMGDSCLKAHLPLSVEAEVFIRSKRGTEQRDQGRGLQRSLRADKHSPFQ